MCAELKGLDIGSLVIEHTHVNKAPKMHRRTHRTHGYNTHTGAPLATEKEQFVPKPEKGAAQNRRYP